jgi:membrane protease YdiL (CAAX protease family)
VTPVAKRERSPATGADWGGSEIVIGVGIVIGTLLVGGIIGSIVDPGKGGDTFAHSGTSIALQAVTALAFIAGAVLALKPLGGDVGPRLGLGPTLIGIPSTLRCALLAILVYGVFSAIFGALVHPEQEDVADNLGYDASTLGNIAIFVLIVIAAPLSEEIFFRGFMFSGIRNRRGFILAALISSVVWGALHFTGGDTWTAVIQLSFFGLVLCWLYEKTGSIRPTIAIHALNNLIAFIYLVH